MKDHIDRLVSLIIAVRKLTNRQILQSSGKGASVMQILALKHIKKNRPQMKEVADFLGITPPSATSLIDVLTGLGMVKRMPDSSDRRSVKLAISAKGEAYLKEMMGEIEKYMRKKLELLTVDDQKKLSEILSKIVNANNI